MREESAIRLIVGIGNPGKEYAGTRHNAGFDTADRFLAKHSTLFSRRHAPQGEGWEGRAGGRNLIVLKPLTFVNLSGDSVLPLMRAEKIAPSEILVIYDDMDLEVGRMRLRPSGGSAGHNGMKSIIEALQTEAFPRLRIGIGNESAKRRADFVLSAFEGTEKQIYEKVLDEAANALELVIRRGVSFAMNHCNTLDFTAASEEKKKTLTEKHQQEVGLEKV